jgi:nitrogen-specific signal transduction histidine kinase
LTKCQAVQNREPKFHFDPHRARLGASDDRCGPRTASAGADEPQLNGIDAMEDTRSDLTVTSRRTEDGQILITVSDSGYGLPVDWNERLFEAVFTTKPQGTGMGLCISRRIVDSHGGRLWAGDNTVRGATFQFTLPSEVDPRSPSAA